MMNQFKKRGSKDLHRINSYFRIARQNGMVFVPGSETTNDDLGKGKDVNCLDGTWSTSFVLKEIGGENRTMEWTVDWHNCLPDIGEGDIIKVFYRRTDRGAEVCNYKKIKSLCYVSID